MNFDALKISALGAIDALLEGVTYKSLIAALLAILLHKHSVLFLAFSALVFIDCFTRWMSLSYKRLQGMGQTPSVMQIIGGIEAARAEGLISSEVMKHRFVGKVIVYILCVLAAVLVDLAMITLHQPVWAVPLVAGYLVITELLSICENLNDAGIEAVQGLVNIIKKRRG
ncbi:phage holin family protein [Phascolarctobacterium succinatutens]|uniref:phage holin family protein n=1 Tax=Phascolarctobacterium succinatutens TaxID=626940 RepID=UPI0023FA1E43|nr:phage holin family protein [Phascolarctobacterium succinatutens]